MRAAQILCPPVPAVSKSLAAGGSIAVITFRINPRLIMRLLPMSPDKPWRSIKAQWKKDAESVGEDYSTFSNGSYAAFDVLTKDGENPSLFCLSDGEIDIGLAQRVPVQERNILLEVRFFDVIGASSVVIVSGVPVVAGCIQQWVGRIGRRVRALGCHAIAVGIRGSHIRLIAISWGSEQEK